MEPLGKKLQQARLARKITLEEASRITKIRPSRIQEIEQEDFSSFANLAYAKGFLLIYGKFLDVDVTPYLDAFEISDRVTVDGYSYLQESGLSAPPPIVRRQSRKGPSILPFIIAVAVLVIGLYLVKFFLNLQRITPPQGSAASPAAAAISATPGPVTSTPDNIVAPRAEPVDETPPGEAGVSSESAPPRATPAPTEPEVRRAQPVHPDDSAPSPPPDVSAAGEQR